MNNKQQNKEQVSASRRQFLRGAAVVSAAGLATSVSHAVADTPAAPVTPTESEQGYHETDHIRAYYASCR